MPFVFLNNAFTMVAYMKNTLISKAFAPAEHYVLRSRQVFRTIRLNEGIEWFQGKWWKFHMHINFENNTMKRYRFIIQSNVDWFRACSVDKMSLAFWEFHYDFYLEFLQAVIRYRSEQHHVVSRLISKDFQYVCEMYRETDVILFILCTSWYYAFERNSRWARKETQDEHGSSYNWTELD